MVIWEAEAFVVAVLCATGGLDRRSLFFYILVVLVGFFLRVSFSFNFFTLLPLRRRVVERGRERERERSYADSVMRAVDRRETDG